MEVKEPMVRYLPATQRSELGEFPADWKVMPLGDFEPFITSGSRGWAAYYADIGSTFLRITNLSRSCIYPSLKDLRYVAVPPGNSEGIRTALQAGDVLISITADIGIVGLVTEAIDLPAYINQHIALVRFDAQDANSRYVAYFLAGEAAQRRFKSMTDAGAKAGMNLTGVREVLAALPPTIHEQAAIANALTDADALIDSLEQLLTKKRQIKQGAMQKLLTGKRRLPGFDLAWSSASMRELITMPATYGIVTAGAFVQQGVRMLRGGDISNGKVNLDLPLVTVEKSDEYSRTKLQQGDVVIALVGYPGESAQIPDELIGANISRAVGLLRPNSKVHGDFLAHLLNSPHGRRKVLAPSAGSAQQVVNLAALNKLSLEIPEPDEQKAIAEILTSMDESIATIEGRLTKARALKQGMAQALLTGRIRLVEPTA